MDPLEQSRIFLDCFKTTVNPDDPLPVWVPIYNLKYDEIEPAIIDWIRTYLDLFGCPQCILTPIIRKVVEQVLSNCKENPKSCGFTGQEYKTLQLNQEVITRVNRVCNELLDNEKLNNLLAQLGNGSGEDQPDSSAVGISAGRKIHFSRAMKHRRRTMEDRHVCLPEYNKLFCTRDTEPTAFYGVYDGHGGQEAASFAASHLHYYIAQSEHYPHDMEQAFREAFLKTDQLFLEKCENHHLNSGSTAVACVHHINSKRIDLAWVGDSQAILVKRNPGEGICKRLVHPIHVGSDPNERQRIKEEGGCVIPWQGQYRVSGQLAITRAIGNRFYKPYVTANPAVSLNQCTEDDLLLILASDGLWEGYSEFLTSMFVLYAIRKFPDDPQRVTDNLITFAKEKTRDNITVIIVFLKDPQTIIKETPFIEEIENNARLRASQNMEINGAASNGFLGENNAIGMEDHKTFDDIQNFMAESVMLEPKSAAALCAGPMDDMGFLSDGGLGPETDVDGVHDSKQQSPSPLLEEAVKSSELDNGDIVHEMANVETLEQHPMDHHNPFAQSLNAPLDLPSSVAVSGSSNVFEEEDPTSPSSVSAADPVELSEEHQLGDAIPHVNGNGEHHYDEPTETEDELLGAAENEAAEIVPALKAELNAVEIVPLKSIDEPIVNDLLGGDSIVDNKLIDQLDSFGIPEAIRRQLIEQQVSGAAMLHEQDEDDDDGQLTAEEKHSDFDGADDGAEKEDLHHEKVFDSDYATDHRSADVKQDDDAGCCEDSEEDEWDYVKVNNQQQQEQESQPAHEKQPESSTPSEEITHTVEHGNSFAPQDDDDDDCQQLLQEGDVQRVQELEQHFEREVVNYTQDVEAPTLSREEEEDRELVEEPHVETTAVPNTSELVAADILGDNTESTVSESTKEVDDVISGGETKEVVNLLNDFKEDVSLPSATDQLYETNCLNEENIASAVPYVPSDSVNMEASMYGESAAEQQPLSPESPVSPVENFPAQQHQQHYSHEKDLFGSDMDDTMTADGEELKEKHLYETEEKSMNLQQPDGSGVAGDYGSQLNPDAKEFVPVTGSVAGEMNVKLHENIKLRDDAIVAQSPRKGTVSSMEDVDVPAEQVFQTEMDKRPHEFEEYGGGDNGDIGADDSAGENRLRSPMAVHPFDLTQFSEQTVVEKTQTSNMGDITNGDYASQDSADDVLAAGTNTNGAQFAADEMELLNKVQQLPADEEATFEVGADTYGSAKEELYVEQKDTMEVSGRVGEMDDMMYHGYANQLPADEVPKSMVTDISESPEFKMLQSSIEYLTATKAAENFSEGQMEQESSNVRKETSALESSVYDPQPELFSTQAAPAVQQLTSNEQMLQASQGYADLLGMSEPVEPPQPTTNKTEEKRDEIEIVTKVPDVEKASGDVAATVAAAAAATVVVAGAAAAATATATSKSTKPKASSTATAAKKPATSVTTKPSSAASKDSAPKTASRVGSSSTAGAAARKPPVGGAETKKAPTSTAAKTASTAMNGVKERPAGATSSKPSLAAKKPAADAAKTATSKTTSATSSVAAVRTKVSSTMSFSTTKTASASSATRTAASKSGTSSSTTTSAAAAGKTSSLRMSTTATTRTVTSRPSSAVSSASVPSKTTTTTSTTAKRTVAAKSSLTNGTTTTDGTSTKSTKITTTTTGSTVPRTGTTTAAARTTGSGLAAKPSNTAAAAKKLLDVKTAAATKTSSTTASATGKTTTMRTSLAPTKATATSPSVRKQNGVPAKKSTAAVSPAPGVKKPAPITKPKAQAPTEQQATITTAAASPPTVTAETNGTGNEVVDVVLASSPPELQPADQLLVPIPQAM